MEVDIHSHLLPGIDDGVETMEESLSILEEMQGLGYRKVITTPHIMADFFPNSPQIINEKLKEVQEEARKAGLSIQIEAAAEYYMDELFIEKLEGKEPLMTFGRGRYLLFETSFINEPAFLRDGIFKISSLGLVPVLAHPERYSYIHNNYNILGELMERGVLFQLNINAISGYYSKPAKKVAQLLIDNNLVSFMGSDCHNSRHLSVLKTSAGAKYFEKAANSGIKNNLL